MTMSGQLLIALFPLILPVWEKGPFTAENIAKPTVPYYLDQAALERQEKYFDVIADPRLRAAMARGLANANNARAIGALERFLAGEKNDRVIADALAVLEQYPESVKPEHPEKLKRFFNLNLPEARARSLALFTRWTGDVGPALAALENDPSAFVSNYLAKALKPFAARCPREVATRLLASKLPEKRAAGARLLGWVAANPDTDAEVKALIEDPDMVVRCALTAALATREQGYAAALAKLAEDKSASVRGFAARMAPTPNHESLLIALAADADPETRRLASINLGNYRTPTAIAALVSRLSDREATNRTAAENALIKINPGKETRERLIAALKNAKERDSAIRVLGELKEQTAAEAILRCLKNAKAPETAERAVTALGNLRYAPAAKTIAANSDKADAPTRRAVAFALGQLKDPETFSELRTLSADSSAPVALEAIKSIGLIADPFFQSRLSEIIHNTSASGSADSRSAAAWALSRLPNPTVKDLDQLQDLCLKQIIQMEMEKTHDADYVRAATCLALIELGKKSPEAAKRAEKVMNKWKTGPIFASEQLSDTLKDYSRQLELYANAKPIERLPVEPSTPELPVREPR